MMGNKKNVWPRRPPKTWNCKFIPQSLWFKIARCFLVLHHAKRKIPQGFMHNTHKGPPLILYWVFHLRETFSNFRVSQLLFAKILQCTRWTDGEKIHSICDNYGPWNTSMPAQLTDEFNDLHAEGQLNWTTTSLLVSPIRTFDLIAVFFDRDTMKGANFSAIAWEWFLWATF